MEFILNNILNKDAFQYLNPASKYKKRNSYDWCSDIYTSARSLAGCSEVWFRWTRNWDTNTGTLALFR